MFNNARHALIWAYTAAETQIVELSSVYRMQEQPFVGAGNALVADVSVQERHMQAAQILGLVARLPDPAAREYIGAAFGHRTQPDQVRVLTFRCCDDLGLPMAGIPAVYLLLKSYFGKSGKLSYRAVRQILRCSNQYALMVKGCLYDSLDTIHQHAMRELEEGLERDGLVRAAA